MESQICPVCTLYLRPGMTLHDHLYTHPKDQVIDALVRLALLPSAMLGTPAILSTPATVLNASTPVLSAAGPMLSASAPVLSASGSVLNTQSPATINTNSQFTAITYRQFQTLTTNVPETNMPMMLNPCLVTQSFNNPPPANPFPSSVIRSSVPVVSYPYYPPDQQSSTTAPLNAQERTENNLQSMSYSYTTQTTQTTQTSTSPLVTQTTTSFNEANCEDVQDIEDGHERYEPTVDPLVSESVETCQEHEGEQRFVENIQEPLDCSLVNNKVSSILKPTINPNPKNIEEEIEHSFGKENFVNIQEPRTDKFVEDKMECIHKDDTKMVVVRNSVVNQIDPDNNLIDTSHSIGTVISNCHRLIANDPSVEYDHDLRADDDYLEHNYDNSGNMASPVSDVSNWSTGSGLRVRRDLNILDEQTNGCIHYVQPNSNAEEYVTSDPYDDELSHNNSEAHLTNLDDVNYSTVLNFSINQELENIEDDDNKEENSAHSVPINIHSDEQMPPRGELSGQESLGATENSVWELQDQGEPSAPSYLTPNKDTWHILGSMDNGYSMERALAERNQNIKCLECDMKFPNVKERRIHVQSVHNTPRHTQVNTNKRELKLERDQIIKIKQERINFNKSDASARTCNLCKLELQSIKELKKHKKAFHDVKRKCETCDTVFSDSLMFKDHIAKVHPIECNVCGKCFPTRTAANVHAKCHLKFKPYQCTICDKSFNSRVKLSEHNNIHSGEAPYKCPMCELHFRRQSNLIQHKNFFHLKIRRKVKDYFCHCGEIFHSIKKLEWHKETHDPKPKQCMYCSERYIHAASLTRHIRHAHDSTYLPKMTRSLNILCPICKITCIRSSLAQHMKIHTGDKPYTCNVCTKEFTTNWNLQMHKWTHASRSSKPYKCKQCKCAFYLQSSYQAHIRSHRNLRPYTCNYCGRQFIRKYNCVRHVKEHETSKSYCCSVCNKMFHRSYYLTEHMRTHTGVKPYTCHICSKTSSTKSNHNKHVRTHHAREPLNTEG